MSWVFIQRILKAGFEIGIALAFENTDRFVMSMKCSELRLIKVRFRVGRMQRRFREFIHIE